ncbi:GntR family transcriptional regulator [Leucobacter sp. CSA1]|uniref:GntR family transcriptional regulator n=1 Tax=Leucobacter chromiisoli TaxID=2796471 RepID=A0A934Q8H5_9MICO|nr:GntR family transcriptional regulator [Leucobacter chromiisoli]MBK0419413.1 GntR family transcriptional regulator [Leucobacter chromiisoli]
MSVDWEPPVRVGTSVYEELRARILTGELSSGARLTVPAIAKQLNVSRSPVRDAVLQLVREGLAIEEFNRGATVFIPSRASLVSLYHAREALEGMAARLAAARTTPEAVSELSLILDEHEAIDPGDFARHIDLDARFHRRVRDLAGSPVLSRMLEEIQGQVIVAMRSTNLSGGVGRATAEHRAILEALVQQDPDAAERVARAHIVRLRRILEGPEQEAGDPPLPQASAG